MPSEILQFIGAAAVTRVACATISNLLKKKFGWGDLTLGLLFMTFGVSLATYYILTN